jgi:short-subunit dehydrogenase
VPLIGFERTPAAVVKTGLRALEQKRGYAIDGPRNRIVAFSARLLPRGIIARVSAQLMGKGIA